VSKLNPVNIWPRNTTFENGEIRIAGIRAQELAKEFGTPAFIIDEDDFRSRIQDFRKALDSTFGSENSDLIYAAKAFLSVQIANWILQEGAGLDVCSGGELAVALAAKFPANRIELHGNNKSVSELRTAIEIGVRVIVADSLFELERIEEIASQLDKKQAILLRLTPGVEAHTHEFISTAHEDVKFGFSISSGAAAVATKKALESKHIEMRGFHCHIGSQIFDNNGFDIAAQRVIEFMAEMKAIHAIEFPDLDLGGGFGIAYVETDTPQSVEAVINRMHEIVLGECKKHGLAIPHLSIEPGRAIAGPSTVTLYEVGTTKEVKLDGDRGRNYISVDGGMSDNIRPALYGAEYSVQLANRTSTSPLTSSRVVGKHCESGDIIIREVELPNDVKPGDLLAIPATGAYGRSMASNYNHQPRPPVIAVKNGQARVILRRETEADLLNLEVNS
jgi:diaminopimelate decarboxylase